MFLQSLVDVLTIYRKHIADKSRVRVEQCSRRVRALEHASNRV